MSKIFFSLLTIVAALLIGFSAGAQAETLFYDSYDTSEANSNINFEIDDRTSGAYGGTGSITYKSHVQDPPTASLTVGTEVLAFECQSTKSKRVFAWLNHDFSGTDSAGGLDVSFSGKLVDPDSAQWYAFAIGGKDADNAFADNPIATAPSALAFLIKNDGSVTVSEYTTGNGTGIVYTGGYTWRAAGNDGQYHDFLFEVRGVGDNNPFDGTGTLNVKMYVDGSATASVDYTSTWQFASNYIGFEKSMAVDGCYFDDLTITKVPEPSTLVLLTSGLIGLLAYAWRKRK
ncbi:MAG: PEP-CTERM sorting domain-containing protein [Pirellulales bacterium]|nr:PEP-CTERM sorting domain-containing protein [Pirellulales bacterium]